MALEKVYPPADIAVLRKTNKTGDNQPALKIAPAKEKYDTQAHAFFSQRLQVLNKPQKVLNMEKHLNKFEEEKFRQEAEAKKWHKELLNNQFKIKQEIRSASINKLQRNAGFMEEWQQKGVEDWKGNQTIKKERERRDLEFEYKQAEKMNAFTMRKINEANKEVHEGISNFEQTLKKQGINPRATKDDAERAVNESFQNSPMKSTQKMQKLTQSLAARGSQGAMGMTTKTGGMTLTSTGLKAKDKKTITDKTRKERERRRRKMIVDQSKTHIDMDQKKRESQIVDRMKRQARQETELGYEEFRTRQCRNVISENRQLREARYERRRELDQQTSNWREEEMIKGLEEQMEREMNVLKERDTEMRILRKQAKREDRSGFASDLFDAIFEIANQAYIHQQLCDQQEIDSRNWHEWLQLFVNQLPINPEAYQKTEQERLRDQEEQELGAEDLVDNRVEDNQMQLDHMELVDYLKNKGQWPETIISEYKVNLEHILTGQGDQPVGTAAGGKGQKAPAAKTQVEAIQLEEGDTEIPESAPNNFILGDAIETVININFEARQEQKRPIIPHHLSLKLCLVGYQFAGKKTQAEKLRQEYGLQVLYLNDLVQEAIYSAEVNLEPIEGIKYSDDNNDQVNNENQSEVDVNDYDNPEEEMRQCGMQIKDLMMEGKEITDGLYVRLFVAKLKITFPYKSKKELQKELEGKVLKEIQIQRKLEEIEKEINGEVLIDHATGKRKKKRSHEQIIEEQKSLNKEREELIKIDQQGWVVVDFPTSFAQAKLLETALSGFVPKVELDLIQREIEQNEASLLVQASEKEQPPVQLIKSGIDGVVWLNCDLEKTLSRAVGRRFDETNEKMYHIQLQPPLTTNAPLCERLVPMNEEFNSEATLIDRWVAFDAHSRAMENWMVQFGDAENERSILTKIDANGSDEETFKQIKEALDGILSIKQDKEDRTRNEVMTKIIEEEEAEKERIKKMHEEEEEKRRLEEEGDHKEEVKKESPRVEKPGAVGEKIAPKPPAVQNIDNDIKPTLHKIWSQISGNYKGQMKQSFRAVRSQRERIVQRLAHIQEAFLQFLHRADTKQEKLDHFIKEFNDFSDQYPDLREDDQTKDELHQRADILSDEMWEIIEERKEQSVEERKKIMESGWVEYELAFLVSCAQQLMQSEVDRFKGSIQIIHDYYHTFEDKLVPDAPVQMTTELVMEGEELPPVEHLQEGQDLFNIDHYSYPRLDKLFERALKAQVVPDVTQIQASAQDKKGAPQKGKDPKKPAQEEEKVLEESIYVKEMKKAIRVEKSLLRYRLIQIRNWSLQRLKQMREKSLKVYQKLDDWIQVSTKTENEAVDEMCIVIKRTIEEEKKIQNELRIKFMDFCVDEKIMNYIEPPREKLSPLEQLKPERFSIPQLTSLVDELQTLAQELGSGASIPNKIVIDLLVRKHENSKSFSDENGLPEEWKHFKDYDYQTMIRNLDKYSHGSISWKLLATYMCLLKSSIPTDKEGDQYQQDLVSVCGKEGFIDEEKFVNVRAWFDKVEYSEDRDYSIPFPRVKYIKELLFKINKEEKDGAMKVNAKKLLSILRAKEVTMFKKNVKTYYDILMTIVEK